MCEDNSWAPLLYQDRPRLGHDLPGQLFALEPVIRDWVNEMNHSLDPTVSA